MVLKEYAVEIFTLLNRLHHKNEDKWQMLTCLTNFYSFKYPKCWQFGILKSLLIVYSSGK